MNKQLDTVFLKPSPQNYAYFLDGDIVDPSEYRELMQVLTSMQEGDSLDLMINCFGGYLHTTIMLSGAIRDCKGHVHGILNGVAMSGGSIVLLSCHSVEVMPHSQFMAHTSNGYNWGKLSDAVRYVLSNAKQLENLYRDVYRGFYTDEEITDILEGKDSYIEYDEICERLEKRAELFKFEHEEYTEACQKQLDEMFGEKHNIPPDWVLSHKSVSRATLAKIIKKEVVVANIDEENKTFELITVDKE